MTTTTATTAMIQNSEPRLSNVGGHTPTSRKNVVRIVEERSSEREDCVGGQSSVMLCDENDFLSANDTTLAISKNDRNSNIFDEVTFRKMLKVKHKNVFILQLDLDKNKNTILKSDFFFGFYKSWNTQWFLVGSN